MWSGLTSSNGNFSKKNFGEILSFLHVFFLIEKWYRFLRETIQWLLVCEQLGRNVLGIFCKGF